MNDIATPTEPFSLPPVPPAARKLKGSAVVKSLLGRAANPKHLVNAARLQIHRKKHRHAYDDAQLALYSRILPSDFLHFGYFDEPTPLPQDMSLAGLARAQDRYAQFLLELAGDKTRPVLDIGCGMGGLSRLLLSNGYSPTALTPDRLQAAHIRATMPDVPVIQCKLEALKTADHEHKYGTLFTAESLQYLKLGKALPVLETLLSLGGRWVACDYFHRQPSDDHSCHEWDAFTARLHATGWRIASQREITQNVLPTRAYIHMWATRFGLPLMQFAFLRLRRKQPGLHHLLSGALDLLTGLANNNVALIDPVRFAAEKRYMLLAMERA